MRRMGLRPFCRALPERLSAAFYYRILKGRLGVDIGGMEAVPRHAPGCRIRLPDSPDFMYESLLCTGFFERGVARFILDGIELGGTMCDVGANIGYFSLLWLAGTGVREAVLIEADDRLASIAEGNLESNGLGSRAVVHALAAGESVGRASLEVEADRVSGWGKLSVEPGSGTKEVEMSTVDVLTAGRRVSCMKVDVEGAEPLVLRGARRLLEGDTLKRVVIEFNEPGSKGMGLDPAESLDVLATAGFRLSPIGRKKPIMNWAAVRV